MERMTMTIKEAAEAMRVSYLTVRHLIDRDENPIPAFCVGAGHGKGCKHLIPVDQLKEWMQEETKRMREARKHG